MGHDPQHIGETGGEKARARRDKQIGYYARQADQAHGAEDRPHQPGIRPDGGVHAAQHEPGALGADRQYGQFEVDAAHQKTRPHKREVRLDGGDAGYQKVIVQLGAGLAGVTLQALIQQKRSRHHQGNAEQDGTGGRYGAPGSPATLRS